VIGSNIFNIFFILGITGLVHPIEYNPAMNFDLEVPGASTILLMVFMFTINPRKLDRWKAFLMLAGYVVYIPFIWSGTTVYKKRLFRFETTPSIMMMMLS
jgi:cation:H+ antiporter